MKVNYIIAGLLISTTLMAGCVIGPTETITFPAQMTISQQEATPNTFTQIPNVPEVAKNKTFPGTIVLGKPTTDTISLSLLTKVNTEVFIDYGKMPGEYDTRTIVSNLLKEQPLELIITGLDKDTQYYYRIYHRVSGEFSFSFEAENSFHTQRSSGSTFIFTVQADSHRDENSSDEIYTMTLLNALSEKPDFHIDLGDTFMGEKWAESYQELINRYIEERSFFSILCNSAPLFLVNGNHEGENGWELNGTSDNIAIWATKARKLYYPIPFSGNFYSGSTKEEPIVGIRQSYYSWVWGDALFVVLDPYWYTESAKRPSGWDWTLGKEQYEWLKTTLEKSTAKFKFVFCHNLVGGFDMSSEGKNRGGTEAAKFYEWGGLNIDRTWGFDQNRPGWGKPIHQLLVENNVTIFFHGHDHFFARQELDGVVYQECPQPGSINDKTHAKEYGYVDGVFIGSPGHIRVMVSGDVVTVDYIRTYPPERETSGHVNGEVAYSYTIRK
jgi:hypothetical protein